MDQAVETRTTRRQGALGVHSLDHFTFSVPDLDEAKRFYEAFGLDVRTEGVGLALYTFGHPHRWGVIEQGPEKKLRYLSFGIYEDDMPRFRQHFARLNIAEVSGPLGLESNGIWIMSPDGVPIEIRVADKCSPDEKTSFDVTSVGPGQAGTIMRSKAAKVHPRRLSHFAVFTPDVSGAVNFYRDVLGLRLSDRSRDIVAFLHGPHGSDHHLIALVAAKSAGMHHSSWDVGTIQDIGLGADQMAQAGYTKNWGMGRHVLGANYFNYIRDPWGSYAEYSCDIDYIPADHDWPADDFPPEDSFFLWGPPPPEDFATNYEPAI